MFLLYINRSEFGWYIKQCPLLGRGPLLGASVNGELTVLEPLLHCLCCSVYLVSCFCQLVLTVYLSNTVHAARLLTNVTIT